MVKSRDIIKLIGKWRMTYQDLATDESNLRDSDKDAERITINEHSMKLWEHQSCILAMNQLLEDIVELKDAKRGN